MWTQTASGWSSDNAQEAQDFFKALQVAHNNGGTTEYLNGTGEDNEAFRMVSSGGKKNLAQIFYNSDGRKAKPMDGPPEITTPNTNNPTNTNNNGAFGVDDARQGLSAVNSQYGRVMATEVEQLYRLETRNFTSGQYRNTGTAGMEAVPGTDAPYYGWNSGLWQSNPEYAPIGTWSAFENKGLSGVGGTKQNTTHKKRFVKLPSVEAGMMYLSGYILRHDGNPAAWYGGDQRLYNQHMAGYKPTIVNSFYQQ